MKFRKKPVVIEAWRWSPDEPPTRWPEWLDKAAVAGKVQLAGAHTDNLRIDTLEGQMTACPGDWIIRGVKGELYPCKPDIFEATYERVQESPQ